MEENKPEAEPKAVLLSAFNGIEIWENPRLSPRCIELRDPSGKVLGTIINIGRVDIGRRP
jgi:hypothetical protein